MLMAATVIIMKAHSASMPFGTPSHSLHTLIVHTCSPTRAHACHRWHVRVRNGRTTSRPPPPASTLAQADVRPCFMDWASAVQRLKLLHTLIYFGGLSSFVIFFVVTVFALSPWPPRLRRRRHTDRICAAMYSVRTPPTAHKRPTSNALPTARPCPRPRIDRHMQRRHAHAFAGACIFGSLHCTA